MAPDEAARDEAARRVADLRAELLDQYGSHPIVLAAYNAATEINDILNAVTLRLALLRWQPNGSRSDASIARLINLVEHAAMKVRSLQDYARAVEAAAFAVRQVDVRREAPIPVAQARIADPAVESAQSVLLLSASEDRRSMVDYLDRCGYRVMIAASPEDAVKLLDSERFDHIVCDTAILGAAGWTFAADVARSAPAARVYFLASDGGPEPQLDGLA